MSIIIYTWGFRPHDPLCLTNYMVSSYKFECCNPCLQFSVTCRKFQMVYTENRIQTYLSNLSDNDVRRIYRVSSHGYVNHLKVVFWGKHQPCACLFLSPGYSTMSPQEDSENPPGNNDPLSAGVDVGNHDDDLDLDTPPQTAALLSHKFHPYRHTHTHHHPLHTHHLQAAVTVHSVDAECWSSARRSPCCCQEWNFF